MDGLKNVLIIEDDAMIRELYRGALVSAGYTVETAGAAEEVYSKLQRFHPQYVFLDIMLPGVSGLEILKELRSNAIHACLNAKIIVLSNLAQRTVAENAMNSGADGYIIKADILPKDLPKVIDSLTDA